MLKTSKGALFLSPFDVCVRSFIYLFYTLIKLYYTKSSEQSSLVTGPRLNSSPPEAKNSSIVHGSATTFHPGGSFVILQGKVRTLGALVLFSPSKHVFCCILLTLLCACVCDRLKETHMRTKGCVLICDSEVTS